MSGPKRQLRDSRLLLVVLGIVLTLALAACGGGDEDPGLAATSGPQPDLKGTIEISGSSTVFPITEAITEEFGKVQPGVRVNLRVSGTGKGFVQFTRGDSDIVNASRAITPIEVEAGISFSV